MSKTHVTETEPGRFVLSKNGRAVSRASARGILAALYPEIPSARWDIYRHTHKTVAVLRRDENADGTG